MSYYRSDSLLREWAESSLKHYLDPHEYPAVFTALRSPKGSTRLTRVELGLLKVLLDSFRPERSEAEQKRYAESNALKVVEVADTLYCNVSTVRRAKERINKLVRVGARQNSHARRHGLLLFHDMGICIRATFWDAIRARAYSETMGNAQLDTHAVNIALAEEKKHGVQIAQDQVRRFQALSPSEQARVLAAAGL